MRPQSDDYPDPDQKRLTLKQQEEERQEIEDEHVFMLEYLFNSHTPGLACLIFVLAEIYVHGSTERMVKANGYLQLAMFVCQIIAIFGIKGSTS